MAFCDYKNAKMVDANFVEQSKFYFTKNFHTGMYINLNVQFDFGQNKWINGISKTELDDNLWFRKAKKFPIYPIMNDLLGKRGIFKTRFKGVVRE